MWNRTHDQHIAIYNNVTPLHQPQSSNATGNAVVTVSIITIVCATIIALVRVAGQVAVSLITSLAAILTSLIAVLPLLAGVAVVLALVYWFLRSLPDAVADVQEIRYQRMIARQSVLLLEQRDAHCITVDSVAARVEAE